MLYLVWLIITSVYVKLGLMTPLQYVRSLSGLTECILNIALPYHMHRQKQTFLSLYSECVCVCGVCGECVRVRVRVRVFVVWCGVVYVWSECVDVHIYVCEIP